MKLFKAFEELDAVELEKLESLQITIETNHTDILAYIGLAAPVLIRVLEFWKSIPGKKRDSRNKRLDKIIAGLQVAQMLSAVKFKK